MGARWGLLVSATLWQLYCTAGWVRLRAGVDQCRISRLHRDSIPAMSSPIAIGCTDDTKSKKTVGSRFTTGYVLEYLVVNRILLKRVLFEWFKLKLVHGPNKLVK
jgi:hypothetical protein